MLLILIVFPFTFLIKWNLPTHTDTMHNEQSIVTALSLYYLTPGWVYLVFYQVYVLDQLIGLDLSGPGSWEISSWVQIQGLQGEKLSLIGWFMFVCLLSSSCLGQLGERVWRKLDIWTCRGASFCSVWGIWLLARHYFGIVHRFGGGHCLFCLRFFSVLD